MTKSKNNQSNGPNVCLYTYFCRITVAFGEENEKKKDAKIVFVLC